MKVLFVSMVVICLILSGVAYAQVAVTSQQSSGTVEQSASNPNTLAVAPTFVPNKISYQGLLTTPLGAPVPDGLYEIKFELFNDVSAGASQWVETQANITVKQGTFSVLLGSVSPLLGIFYQPLWMEITAVSGPGISSPILFSPRTELASSAYSLGPLVRDSVIGYNLPGGRLSIGSSADISIPWGVDVKTGTLSAIRTKNIPGFGTTGFWADKGDSSGRNYLVLRTAGADRWSLGTMYNDNFSLYNWTYGRYDFYATMNGLVGIGTNSPTKKLDVNGAVQVKDTLFVGSSTVDGAINVFQNGAAEPTIKANKYPGGYGGQITLQDELGNPIVDLRPNGWGEGGGIKAYRTTSQVGFEGWGNWYGLGEGYAAVYGNNRSIIFEPRFAGNESVQLPDSSISAAEILDEPGISNSQRTIMVLNSTSGTVVIADSVDITVPAAGYIEVTGGAWLNIYHTTGTITEVWLGINTVGASQSTFPGLGVVRIPSELPTSTSTPYGYPGVTRRFYSVAAGSYRYYLNLRFVGGGSSAQAGYPYIQATYYPTLYGTSTVMSPTAYYNPDSKTDDSAQINLDQIQISPEEHLQQLKAKAVQLKSELDATIKQLDKSNGSSNGSQR
ncbi:MAG: hypothetical protein C0417_13265 [Chlorobiaceae bacterium]|nr:hypothetical protein [Chlorobiaceae bacterium]